MGTTSERIITANITSEESTHGIKYIDSLNFMSASLAELANNLPADQLTSVRKFIEEMYPQLNSDEAFDLLRRKGVYPYDWMDDLSKMSETSIPNKEAFYNELNDVHVDDEDYEHAKRVWSFFGCKQFKDYHELYLPNVSRYRTCSQWAKMAISQTFSHISSKINATVFVHGSLSMY